MKLSRKRNVGSSGRSTIDVLVYSTLSVHLVVFFSMSTQIDGFVLVNEEQAVQHRAADKPRGCTFEFGTDERVCKCE